MANVGASGSGVASDALRFLQFGTKRPNTFNVDLKEGLYKVSVTLGDTARASIAAEGVFEAMSRTGNGARDSFEIPLTKGKVGTAFTLSALLVTPQGRATDFVDSVHSSVNRWYRNSKVALAGEENVPLVDLNVLASAHFTEIGPEATLALFMTGDTLHSNRAGAGELARLVSEDVGRQGLRPRRKGPESSAKFEPILRHPFGSPAVDGPRYKHQTTICRGSRKSHGERISSG